MNTTKNVSKITSLIMAFAFALPLLSIADSASARSQAAILGNPFSRLEYSCFDEVYGGVAQRCTSVRAWSIPIVYDNAYNVAIRVSTNQINSSAVMCQQFSVTDRAGSLRASPKIGTNGIGYCQPPAIAAHGFGGTWMRVYMSQNTEIYNVHY